MSVNTNRWKQDGVVSVKIRRLVNGSPVGNWLTLGGPSSVASAREITERELLGGNVVYSSTSKFKKYAITIEFWGLAPDLMPFLLPGELTIDGNVATFVESSTGQPYTFEMVIESDGDDEGGNLAVIGQKFTNCITSNFNNPSQSGEYTSYQMTVNATIDGDSSPRSIMWDMELAGYDTTGDDTPPTVSATVPTAGATGVSVSANITANFSEEMMKTSVEDPDNIKLFKTSDNSQVSLSAAGILTYTPGSPYQLVINPASSLSGSTTYGLLIRNTVRDVAGNRMVNDYITTFTTA